MVSWLFLRFLFSPLFFGKIKCEIHYCADNHAYRYEILGRHFRKKVMADCQHKCPCNYDY